MTAFAGLTMLLITAAAIAQDSLNKRRIGEILPAWDAAQGVKVQGNFAYVAAGTSGLYILNVSNPSQPSAAGYYNTMGTAFNADIVGTLAYVADGARFGVYDFSALYPAVPPLAPTALTINPFETPLGLTLHWNAVTQDLMSRPVTIHHYTVYRSVVADFSGAVDSLGVPNPPDAVVFTDSLSLGQSPTFFYRITASSNP